MRDADDILRRLDRFSTVLVAGTSKTLKSDLVRDLHERGVNLVGPFDTAAKALALAATASPHLALVEPQLAGRRGGVELAHELQSAWGVQSLLLPVA